MSKEIIALPATDRVAELEQENVRLCADVASLNANLTSLKQQLDWFKRQLFGSKSEKDIKEVNPLLEKILAEYEKLGSLSNDELRNKTNEFREAIKTYLSDIDDPPSLFKSLCFPSDNPICLVTE